MLFGKYSSKYLPCELFFQRDCVGREDLTTFSVIELYLDFFQGTGFL